VRDGRDERPADQLGSNWKRVKDLFFYLSLFLCHLTNNANLVLYYFFTKYIIDVDAYIDVHTLIPMKICTQPYSNVALYLTKMKSQFYMITNSII
jgi:hypothetical protein